MVREEGTNVQIREKIYWSSVISHFSFVIEEAMDAVIAGQCLYAVASGLLLVNS